jgi:uncharacterized iron-regulated membrane protein
MAKRLKKLKKLARRPLPLAVTLVLILIALGLGWVHWHNKSPQTTTGGSLSPATTAEKQAAADHKDQIVQQQQNQSSPAASGTKSVTLVITEASSTGIKGYVQGVFEDGGTCTATATQGSQTVTKTSAGFANVSYTQCAPINWTLGSGTWTVSLSYKSVSASGSASRTIEVK